MGEGERREGGPAGEEQHIVVVAGGSQGSDSWVWLLVSILCRTLRSSFSL